MKTLADLFQLVAQATEENRENRNTWFIRFSGHVNIIKLEYWFSGYDSKYPDSRESLEEKITEEGIQSAYWFIKTRLRA